MISLLTWTWRLTDAVYKFSYSTFDKALYILIPFERDSWIHVALYQIYLRIMCAKIYLTVKRFGTIITKKRNGAILGGHSVF